MFNPLLDVLFLLNIPFFTIPQVFDLLMNGSDLIKKVADNTKLFRTKMTAAGFNIIVSNLSQSMKNKYSNVPLTISFTFCILHFLDKWGCYKMRDSEACKPFWLAYIVLQLAYKVLW